MQRTLSSYKISFNDVSSNSKTPHFNFSTALKLNRRHSVIFSETKLRMTISASNLLTNSGTALASFASYAYSRQPLRGRQHRSRFKDGNSPMESPSQEGQQQYKELCKEKQNAPGEKKTRRVRKKGGESPQDYTSPNYSQTSASSSESTRYKAYDNSPEASPSKNNQRNVNSARKGKGPKKPRSGTNSQAGSPTPTQQGDAGKSRGHALRDRARNTIEAIRRNTSTQKEKLNQGRRRVSEKLNDLRKRCGPSMKAISGFRIKTKKQGRDGLASSPNSAPPRDPLEAEFGPLGHKEVAF